MIPFFFSFVFRVLRWYSTLLCFGPINLTLTTHSRTYARRKEQFDCATCAQKTPFSNRINDIECKTTRTAATEPTVATQTFCMYHRLS